MKIEEYIHRRRLTVNAVAKECSFTSARVYRYNYEIVNKRQTAEKIATAMTNLGKNTTAEDIIRSVDCFRVLRREAFDENNPVTFMKFLSAYGVTAKALAEKLSVSERKIKEITENCLPFYISVSDIAKAIQELGVNLKKKDIVFFFDDLPMTEKNKKAINLLKRKTEKKETENDGGNNCWNCWNLRRCPNFGRKRKDCKQALFYRQVTIKEIGEEIGMTIDQVKKFMQKNGFEELIALAREKGLILRRKEDSDGTNIFYKMERTKNE